MISAELDFTWGFIKPKVQGKYSKNMCEKACKSEWLALSWMRKNTQAALCRGMNVNYYKKNLAACLQGVLPKLCQYFSHSLSSPPSNANKFLYPLLSSLAFKKKKKKQPYNILKCQLITFQSVNIYIYKNKTTQQLSFVKKWTQNNNNLKTNKLQHQNILSISPETWGWPSLVTNDNCKACLGRLAQGSSHSLMCTGVN